MKPGSFGSGCFQNSDCVDTDASCVHVDEYFSQRILGSVTSDSNGRSITGTCVKLATENSPCNLNPTGTNPNIGCQSGLSCTSHYGFNSVGSCFKNNAVGSGCLYSDDCKDGSTCVDSSWNIVTTSSSSNSYWPLPSKCIVMNRALDGICEYAFDESVVTNRGCSAGLICSGSDGFSISGTCKYKLNSQCFKSDDCVRGTNCYDTSGQLILSSSTATSGTCLLDLGSLCSSSDSCNFGTSCVFKNDQGEIILDSKTKDPSSPYGTIFGICVTLGNDGDPCNYDSEGIPDSYSGCNSKASPPLYCYNGFKLSTSGMCEPYIPPYKALPFDTSNFVAAKSSEKRDFLYPRDISTIVLNIGKPLALANIFDIDISNVLSFFQRQKSYKIEPQAPDQCPLTNFKDFIVTDGAGTGQRRLMMEVGVSGDSQSNSGDNIERAERSPGLYKVCGLFPSSKNNWKESWRCENANTCFIAANGGYTICGIIIQASIAISLSITAVASMTYSITYLADKMFPGAKPCLENNDCPEFFNNEKHSTSIRSFLLI